MSCARAHRAQRHLGLNPGGSASRSKSAPGSETLRHAVLGPGGIGALVAAALARAGREVVLLIRPLSLRSYPGRIQVESAVLGSFAVEVDAESLLSRAVDVLWVTPKATVLDAAIGLAPPARVGRAAVVPLMNGIDHVARLRGRYELVVAGAIRVESERGPDWFVHEKTPFIRVELGPGGEEVAGELRAAGVDCTTRANEASVLWEKLAFLAPVALTTSALGEPIGAVRHDPCWRARLERAQAEVVAVASAEGVQIDEDALRSLHAAVPEATQSSMQKDVAAGRQPELDAIAGPLLRGGERYAVDVPVTRELVALVAQRVAAAR
jgi:2-dehydropantoate 2-reductase